MGCCLLAAFGLLVPRVLLFFMWLLRGDWFAQSFHHWVWPVLGFLFMPYTTLAYMAGMLNNHGHISGGWLVLVIVAVLVDIGHWGGGQRSYRVRRGRAT